GSDYPPPANLTLVDIPGVDSLAVNISWETDERKSHARVFQVEVCIEDEDCNVGYTVDTHVVWEGLDYWTNYFFEVSGLFHDGNDTLRSGPATRRHNTGPGAPGLPSSLLATSYESDAFVVSWGNPQQRAPKKPSAFNLQVCEVSETEHCARKIFEYSKNGYQVRIDGLQEDKDYRIQISAFIQHTGNTYTGPTANATVRTLPQQFQAPWNVRYRLVPSDEDVEVLLKWNVQNDTGRLPDRFVVDVCRFNKCRPYSTTTQQLVIDGLRFWSHYNATVWALYPTSRKATTWSNGTSVTMYTGPGSPRAPSFVSAVSLGPHAVTLLWQVVLDAAAPQPDAFRVSICDGGHRCMNFTKPLEGRGIHKETVRRLAADTRYQVYVSTILSYENVTFTSPAATTDFTTEKLLDAPPANLSASLSPNQHDVDVRITWSVPEHLETKPFKYKMEVRGKENLVEVYEIESPKKHFSLHFALEKRPFWTNYTVDLVAFYDGYQGVVVSPASKLSLFTGPGAPEVTNLTLTAVSRGELMATWDAPQEHVDGFQLTICSSGTTRCMNITVPRDVRKYRIIHLAPWTRYTVGVFSFVGFGGKTYRGVPVQLTAITDPAEPSIVRELNVTLLNITNISISWEEPEEKSGPLSGYFLSCNNTDAQHPYTVERLVPGDSTHHAVDLVVQVSTFECSVWAFNHFRGIRLNGTAARQNITTTGIRAPRKLAVTSKSTTSLSLEWELNPDAVNFSVSVTKLPKSSEPSFVEEHEKDCDGNTTVCYNVTGLEPGAHYEVSVKNCAGYCGNPATITADTQVGAPSEVRNLSVTQVLNRATFEWRTPEQPNGPVDGYIVRVANLERQDSQVHDVPGNTTSLAARLGEQYNNYTVSVQAYNILLPVRKAGPAVVMDFESAGKGPIPPRPEVDDINVHDVELSWTKPKDQIHEIIEFEVTISGYNKRFITTNTSANIVNLETWTEYTVNISSCTSENVCGPPKTSQFRTDADAPSVPQDLNYTSVGDVWVALNWSNPETLNGPLSGFNVSWTNGSFTSSAITRSNQFNITHLDQGCSYTISVFAFNKGLKILKGGPSVNITVKTEGEPVVPGCILCPSTIVMMVVIPVICIVLIAAYVLYRRALRKK
ncbi:unnamed protein product, partial [Ixodes hexagonus]